MHCAVRRGSESWRGAAWHGLCGSIRLPEIASGRIHRPRATPPPPRRAPAPRPSAAPEPAPAGESSLCPPCAVRRRGAAMTGPAPAPAAAPDTSPSLSASAPRAIRTCGRWRAWTRLASPLPLIPAQRCVASRASAQPARVAITRVEGRAQGDMLAARRGAVRRGAGYRRYAYRAAPRRRCLPPPSPLRAPRRRLAVASGECLHTVGVGLRGAILRHG